MSNKSGTSNQVLSLPKGGGALRGIGEKFSPDLHTGTGNFTIPIALPPGRNGFQPQLSLVYSTGNGNGPFGLGWSLSMPGVSRKTSKGIPIYDDSDVFVLSGAEDLVPVEQLSEATRYRPRTEGLFARILRRQGMGSDYWEVHSKDGLVSVYGTPRPVGADPHWQDSSVIADPDNQSRVFAWKVSRTTDPFGNSIEYRYLRDAVQIDGPHHWDQLYLSQIRYVDYGDRVNPQFLVTVNFTYEDRPDPFSDYRAGFEIRTTRRCTAIEVFTHPGVDILTRTYHLDYLDQQGLPSDRLPLNGVSLLAGITVEGHDGANSESLPPLEFGYTRFTPAEREFIPITGPDLPPVSLAHPDYELADLLGTGLPDILEMNGTVRFWRNLGGGRFDLPRPMRDAPAGLGLANPAVQLVDANGDGRIDLMVSTESISGYYPSRFGGVWDHRSFQPYRTAPSFSLKDPEVRLVDLDGDGVTDAVRSGSRIECFFNDPHEGWSETREVERKTLDVFPNINFSDARVKWADMSGDGLQDIVLVHNGDVEYWPNLGRGNWGAVVSMRKSPRFPYGYDPRRILLGDVDGDGLADLVYVDDTEVTLWINQSGNVWSDPITIQGTPPVSDMDAVRLADILGNGIGGVLWTSDATSLSRAHMFFLDFTGGTKPYLMNEMNNHTGSVTRVKYQPSTRFYLCDEERLDTRWKTPLPFPVQVVARIEVIDQISGGKLTTEYSYHHGYWDGAEREFRGFGRTDQRDTEVFDDFHASGLHDPDRSFEPVAPRYFSPPTETRTWFHQGPVGDEFGEWEETDFSAEFWPGDPQILSRPPLMTNFLESLPRRVKRDALRTLQGRILRTELYALDRTARQDRPYTVSEYQFGVCEVVTRDGRQELSCEPRLEDSRDRLGDEWPARVFFPHALGQRTTQWERGDDPVTQFSFTEDYNENGQPRRQTQIACPRGWQRLDQIPAQAYLATSARTVYAVPLDPDVYILDRVSRITTYEILNDGTQRALDLKDLPDDSPSLKIIGQNLNYYDGDAFSGRPFGKVGNYGALVRSESLVLTEEILSEAYKSGDAISNPPELPPYLVSGVPIVWTDEYPQDYRNSTQVLAGYLYKDGAVGSPYAPGYFAVVARHQYDFQLDPAGVGRGLRKVTRDPLGRDTAIRYDPYDLLPIEITDPAGLRTKVTYDYRVLQPQEATEPNENRSRYTFTPLGLVRTIAVMGKAGENVGDTDATPGALFEYDFAFSMDPDPKPISVKTTRRVHHTNDRDVSLAQRDQTIVSIEYSDGFGRLHQTRTQAEDVIFDDPALVAPVFGQAGLLSDQTIPVREAVGKGAEPGKQWAVVSGWQFYDNKGRVVEKYEPFFSIDWNYAPPSDSEFGQKDTLYYDPRGRVIRTVKADGSEQRIIYGVPADLSDPDDFSPTPWETYTYDANDNSGRTHPADSQSYQHHWNTPTSASKDALGRTVLTTDRNRRRLPAGGWSPVEEYYTRSAYDIRGNLLTVIDTLGRKAFNHIYDLSNNPLRFQNIDAGVKRAVLDASGNIVERRDSKGAVILNAYDLLNRPVQLWARDNSNERVTLRERLEYGDGGDPNQPANERTASRSANLLGKLSRHYDEAGLLSIESNDFKGNILEKSRQVIRDEEILKVFNPAPTGWRVPAFRVDWTPPAGITLQNHANNLLEAGTYQTSITYDALNRIKMMRYPQDEDGARKTLSPHYNRAGALERVELNGVMYVERIAYNAKGQRTLIVYGNGLMTRYSYDVGIFRLVRMRTEPYSSRDPQAYYPAGPPLQDLAYGYDLTGNILSIVDRTPGCGVLNNPDALQAVEPTMARLLASGNSLIRRFEYDPLYRLQSATGRECSDISRPRAWPDDPRCGFNGNNAGTPNQGNAPNLTAIYREDYAYDAAGNMVSMRHSNNRNSWTRLFGMGGLTPQLWNREWPNHLGPAIAWANASGNILTHVGDDQPGPPQTHFFDDNGNLVRETSSRHFEWDHSDRMRVYRTQARSALALLGMDRWAEPSVHTHYLYDTAGQRVKKLVRTQGGDYEVTVYIDGIFEHYRWNNNDVPKENDRLYILDDKSCIAIVRIGERHADDNGPVVQYHLGDHLGTSTVVINDIGDWINREEYLPYGETSFGSFAKKRYRYTGKERDEESGLYYHGARYLAPWLARWISPDPVGISDGLNVYAYVRDNPLSLVDRSGRSSGAPDKDLPNWLRQLREAEGEIKRQEEALRSGKASQEAGDVAWQDAEQVGDQIAREYIDRGERLTESMRRLEAHQEERERLSPKELNATRRSVEDVTREIRDRSSRQVVDDIRSAEKQLEHERQLRDFERRLGEPPPEEGGGGGGGGKWGGRGGGGGVGGRGGGFGSTPLGGALFGIIVTIIYEGLKDFVLAGSGLDLERREAKADVFYFSPEQERELSLIRAEREVERLIERRALEQGISVDEQRKRMDAALKSLPPYPVLTAGRN